jgi:hypothetical protein
MHQNIQYWNEKGEQYYLIAMFELISPERNKHTYSQCADLALYTYKEHERRSSAHCQMSLHIRDGATFSIVYFGASCKCLLVINVYYLILLRIT